MTAAKRWCAHGKGADASRQIETAISRYLSGSSAASRKSSGSSCSPETSAGGCGSENAEQQAKLKGNGTGKIFKQLARHWAACLAVVALLFVQAYCDLPAGLHEQDRGHRHPAGRH